MRADLWYLYNWLSMSCSFPLGTPCPGSAMGTPGGVRTSGCVENISRYTVAWSGNVARRDVIISGTVGCGVGALRGLGVGHGLGALGSFGWPTSPEALHQKFGLREIGGVDHMRRAGSDRSE